MARLGRGAAAAWRNRILVAVWTLVQPVLNLPFMLGVRGCLRERLRGLQHRTFAGQRNSSLLIHAHKLELPEGHSLHNVLEAEPFREHLLAAAAGNCLTPDVSRYVDVGANIGDTAALVNSVTGGRCKMVLIEPSDVFFTYLRSNSAVLGHPELHHRYVSSSFPIEPIPGVLAHWGGTAQMVASNSHTISPEQQMDLIDVIDEQTDLVKLDCDGMDLAILAHVIPRLDKKKPVFMFENSITDMDGWFQLRSVMDEFANAGYTHFVAAHYSGALLFAGKVCESLWDIFRFQLNAVLQGNGVFCYYTDVLAYHESDESMFFTTVETVRGWQNHSWGERLDH